jgi:hypothetical protein
LLDDDENIRLENISVRLRRARVLQSLEARLPDPTGACGFDQIAHKEQPVLAPSSEKISIVT